jgi:hypothetical protein
MTFCGETSRCTMWSGAPERSFAWCAAWSPWSAPTTAACAEDAQTLFEEGRAALAQGRYDVACDRLARSQALDPAPGTQLNLADCEERRGRLKTAQDHFRAVARAGLEPFAAEGDKRAAALDARVPTLRVALAEGVEAPPGVAVLLDGAPFEGRLGEPTRVDPGRHKLVLRAPSRVDVEATVDLDAGAREGITLTLGAPVASPPPEGGGPPTLGIVGLVTGGLGVVALGAAIGTGVAMLDAGRCFKAEVPADCPSPPDEDERARGKTLEAASTALFIVGGALAATGLVLTIVAPWGGDAAGEPSVALDLRPTSLDLRVTF